jgi:hypothetical protein
MQKTASRELQPTILSPSELRTKLWNEVATAEQAAAGIEDILARAPAARLVLRPAEPRGFAALFGGAKPEREYVADAPRMPCSRPDWPLPVQLTLQELWTIHFLDEIADTRRREPGVLAQ